MIALLIYAFLAAVLYVRYENTDHTRPDRKTPRFISRFAVPWYYSLSDENGNWFFGFWDHRKERNYPELGIRLLGFEFWIEYYK